MQQGTGLQKGAACLAVGSRVGAAMLTAPVHQGLLNALGKEPGLSDILSRC